MYYYNKVCDGCCEIMLDGDDIVVCPDCGTPQHRECYNKNNECVNAHLHAEGFDWREANTQPEKSTVPENEEAKTYSEEENSSEETNKRFFSSADEIPDFPLPEFRVDGIFINGQTYTADEDIGGATVKETVTYTQVNSINYIKKFIKNKGRKKFLSWNWGALIFGPAWFFYRKLYKIGALFLALSTSISIITAPYLEPIVNSIYETMSTTISMADYKKLLLFSAPALVTNIIFTLIANYFYRKKMLEDINFAKEATSDPKVLKYSLIRRGGVSFLAGLFAMLASQYLPGIIMTIVSYF